MQIDGKIKLPQYLHDEGMDMLVFFKKKDIAVVCNYRGDIRFQMKTDPKALIDELRKRNTGD